MTSTRTKSKPPVWPPYDEGAERSALGAALLDAAAAVLVVSSRRWPSS